MPPTADRIAALFPGALGDFICWLPSVIALRAEHAGPMLMMAQPALLELLRWRELTTASIDRREVANLFATETRIADATRTLLGNFGRVYSWTGFGDDGFTRRLRSVAGGAVEVFPFRGMRADEHAVDYYARCLGVAPVSVSSDALREDDRWVSTFLHEHHLDGRPILVVHPGSGSPKKNWLGFAALMREWRIRCDEAVVWLEGPAERERALEIPTGVIRINSISLPQVTALFRHARCYVGNDSGVSHLAGAMGIRGVVLFASTDPAVWAPRGETLRVLHAPEPCGRCGMEMFCTHRLAVEAVLEPLMAQRATQ